MAEQIVIKIPKMEDKDLRGPAIERVKKIITIQGNWLIEFAEKYNELVDEVDRNKGDTQTEIDGRIDNMMTCYIRLDSRINWIIQPWYRKLWRRMHGEKIPQ